MALKLQHPIVLGISSFYHDSAAALTANGEIIAAAQEERFTRRKFDSGFPEHSIYFCLEHAGIDQKELDCIAFYDEPLVKLDRIIETQTAFAPLGFFRNWRRIQDWVNQKFSLDKLIYSKLPCFSGSIFYCHHHLSHAASAFYPSPFRKASIVVVDAMGEWACSSIGKGEEKNITILQEQRYPNSVGLLYSAITQHIGFKVNSGEYKVMGLAPYGEPRYVRLIKDHLVEIHDDGSIILNTEYFDFMVGGRMTNDNFNRLFGAIDRTPESMITQREMDIARSIQVVIEEIMLNIARYAVSITGERNMVLAGGVALNCVANGKIRDSRIVDNLWIQPSAGDAGGALGAALFATYNHFNGTRAINEKSDSQKGSFLGPVYSKEDIRNVLDAYGFEYEELDGERKFNGVCDLLCDGNVIGVFQGQMEFGPRALGARSIIGDPRNPNMQKHMNLKIKYRESFRPFAPIVLAEEAQDWFESGEESPYMLLTTSLHRDKRIETGEKQDNLFGIDKLNVVRSKIPAVTHVNNSARIQTVDRARNAFTYELLKSFQKKPAARF
jgi:carbamoyltransferase